MKCPYCHNEIDLRLRLVAERRGGHRPEPTADRSGYIYLLRSENGYYKIGRTVDIESRLSTIQREIPVKVELLHYFRCRDYIETERELHERFAEFCQEREWFRLPESEVRAILEMSDEF